MKKSAGFKNLFGKFFIRGEGMYAVNPVIPAAAGLAFFAAVTAGAFILSNNIYVSVVVAALAFPFFMRSFLISLRAKRKRKIEREFLEAMQLVLAAVTAGNSVEQAFESVCGDCRNGSSLKIAHIAPELDAVCRKTGMLYHFYDELLEFAGKTGSEDIISCVKAMSIVGIRGGNMAYVIRNALSNIRIKFETDAEIAGSLALPRYNLRIITVMPFALVLLVKSMSKGYMDTLYGSSAGLFISIGAMVLIGGAWILGSKLCNIEI